MRLEQLAAFRDQNEHKAGQGNAEEAGSERCRRAIESLPEQRAHVYRGGVRIGVSTVSTARPRMAAAG